MHEPAFVYNGKMSIQLLKKVGDQFQQYAPRGK
jgi:hypothetical protein